MKKFLFLMIAVSCFATNTATTQVTIALNTSAIIPTAGSVLNLTDGESGAVYVWAQNNEAVGKIIDGLSFDLLGAGSSTLTATAYDIVNGGHWLLGAVPGTLGIGTVNVTNAVPEPGSLIALAGLD